MYQRKTKIVCTLGPATESVDGIASLLEAGMDVVRLNFSHGDREDHRKKIRRIREVSKSLGREVGILQDLGGPKIRLGELPAKPDRQLRSESRVRLETRSSRSAIHISSRTLVSGSASSSPMGSPNSRFARSRATGCSARSSSAVR